MVCVDKGNLSLPNVTDIIKSGAQELDVAPIKARKAAYEENNNKSGQALFIIHQSVDAYILEKILGVNTTKEALDILAKSYEGAEKLKKVKLQTLRRQYKLLQMNDQESLAERKYQWRK